MIGLAVGLGLTGLAVLLGAARGLWISRPYHPDPCGWPSPDGDDCSGTLAHVGWHHADGKEWYGDTWRLPTDTVAVVSRTATMLQSDWRERPMGGRGWVLLALAVVALCLIVAAGVETPSSPAPDPHANCAMAFSDANALHPLCDDSPWWAEHHRSPPK